MDNHIINQYVTEELKAIREMLDEKNTYKKVDLLLKRAIKNLEKQ